MSLVLGFGLEHSCSWPREGLYSERLSLATECFCVLGLGLEPCVLDSTSDIELGKFPDSLKIAKVMPMLKKGDSNQENNCRPISLLWQFSKVFEKLICNRLHYYLEKYNSLSKHLYGFKQNSSSTHTLCNIYKNCKNSDDSL